VAPPKTRKNAPPKRKRVAKRTPKSGSLLIEERQRHAVALRRAGHGFQEIADALEISLGQAFADVKAVRERVRAEAEEDVEAIQATESERLELLVQKLTPLLNKPKQAIRAAEVLKAVSESRRKLHGADAPNRHEHSGPQGAPIQVDARDALLQKLAGLVAGALAKLIMPGRDPGGILVTMLLGVAGAFVAGFLGRAFGWYTEVGDGPGIIASIVGALVLLGLYRVILGARTRA
jgi:uncharacterized membrane protein YeaQ/YmgE (transglycosylase-associated protein family)/DNA-binding CsgD family transcriptional regulator